MRKTIRQKCAFVLILVMLTAVLSSCMAANSEVEIKQSGKAVITGYALMDETSLRDTYGMPTNFYDAVEKDGRFAGVSIWKKEYVDRQIDGVNYTGVKVSGEFAKKEIQTALNQLYGQYASVSYSDKNVFGKRTIHISMQSNGNRLMAEEMQNALDGQLLSSLTITIPGKIKTLNGGTKNGEKTVVLDTLGLLTGETPNVTMEAQFADYTFFIPFGVVLVLAIAAIIVVASRVKHEAQLKKNSKSIKLEKKPKRGGFSDDLDKPYQPKGKLSFTKQSPPKYTATEAAPVTEVPKPSFAPKTASSAPAAEPVVEETPVAPAPEKPAYQPMQFRRRRMPSSNTFTQTPVAPAPEPVAEPVYEEPAPVYEEPAYEEPVYEEPVYEEPAYEEPVYEEPAYEQPAYEEPVYEEPVSEEPAPVYEEPASVKIGRTSGALMQQETQMGTYHEKAGSAKFSKENRDAAPAAASTGSTIFTPRSTAPNYAYGMEGYHEEHQTKDSFENTESSTLFTPRSTAANLNYGHEEHKPVETLSTGSTLFTPRSTAPNMNYGVKDPLEGEKSIYDEPERNKDFFYGKDFTKAPKSTTYEAEESGAVGKPVYGHVEFEEMSEEEAAEYDENAETYNYATDYDDGGYEDASYYNEDTVPSTIIPVDTPSIQPIEQTSNVGSIYQTNGYESSGYESANVGASEKSAAIKDAYGGSKLGSGAYVGGATTGTRVGRSVGNIGGYVDETMVNTSSYGSDPFGGSPLPKLGEMGAGGAGMFAIGSTGGFGSSSYEGNTIGEGTFGSSKYQPAKEAYRMTDSSTLKPHSEVSSAYGKTFNTGGTGRFDFGMASSDSGRKCPFCKEPIRDDDIMCVACGATLSRPYGSF